MVAKRLSRSLDAIQTMLSSIFDEHDRICYPSIERLMLKLVWAIGKFSAAERKGDHPVERLCDTFAMWVATCQFFSYKVTDILALKYPGICLRCRRDEDCDCEGRNLEIDWLAIQGHLKTWEPPQTMAQWQAMFQRIYGRANAKRGYDFAVARLPEEESEVIEWILLLPVGDTTELKKELADLGARIFAIANILSINLEEAFLARYDGDCPVCEQTKCSCDPQKAA